MKKSVGFNWGTSAVSTTYWTGFRLCDLLKHCGAKTPLDGAKYVHFKGVSKELPQVLCCSALQSSAHTIRPGTLSSEPRKSCGEAMWGQLTPGGCWSSCTASPLGATTMTEPMLDLTSWVICTKYLTLGRLWIVPSA